jgi:hypothetical protein
VTAAGSQGYGRYINRTLAGFPALSVRGERFQALKAELDWIAANA